MLLTNGGTVEFCFRVGNVNVVTFRVEGILKELLAATVDSCEEILVIGTMPSR